MARARVRTYVRDVVTYKVADSRIPKKCVYWNIKNQTWNHTLCHGEPWNCVYIFNPLLMSMEHSIFWLKYETFWHCLTGAVALLNHIRAGFVDLLTSQNDCVLMEWEKREFFITKNIVHNRIKSNGRRWWETIGLERKRVNWHIKISSQLNNSSPI